MRLRWFLGAVLVGLGVQGLAATEEDFDPSRVDLAALIECRADVPTYNNFAIELSMHGTGVTKALGLTKVESGNSFLSQYELARPITVFGYQTKTIVFSSSGPLAVLENVTPQALAEKLGVTAAVSTPDKFLGDKLISKSTDGELGLHISVKLNVSTVTSHPGKTLAGCSYRIDVE